MSARISFVISRWSLITAGLTRMMALCEACHSPRLSDSAELKRVVSTLALSSSSCSCADCCMNRSTVPFISKTTTSGVTAFAVTYATPVMASNPASPSMLALTQRDVLLAIVAPSLTVSTSYGLSCCSLMLLSPILQVHEVHCRISSPPADMQLPPQWPRLLSAISA